MDERLSVSEATISLCGHPCGILVMFYLGSAGATCSRCSNSHRDHWCPHTHQPLVFVQFHCFPEVTITWDCCIHQSFSCLSPPPKCLAGLESPTGSYHGHSQPLFEAWPILTSGSPVQTQYRASLKQVFDCLTNKELTSFWHREWH